MESSCDLKKSLDRFDRLIAGNPEFLPSYLQKGTILLDLLQPKDAIACFDFIIDKKNGSELELAYLYKGIALLDLNDLTQALWYFKKVLELNNKCDQAYYFKGKSHLLQNQLSEAEESFQRGLALDSNNLLLCCGKGELLLKNEKFPEALKSFEQAQIQFAKCPKVAKRIFFKSLIDAYSILNRTSLDKENLKILLRLLDQASFHPQKGTILNYQGNVCMKLWKLEKSSDQLAYSVAKKEQNYLEKAKICYEEVLKEDPKNYWVLNNKGLVYQESYNYEIAIESFSQAISLRPSDPLFRFNRGKCYYLLAKKNQDLFLETKAIQDFDKIKDEVSIQNLSNGNLKMIISKLNKIIEAGILARRISSHSSNPYGEQDEKRLDIVNAILDDHNESLDESFKKLLSMILDLQNKHQELSKKLDTKINDYSMIFLDTIEKLNLSLEEQRKLEKYRQAFEKTFSVTLISCKAVNSGTFSLDTDSNVADAISFVATFIPIFGDSISSTFSSLHSFFSEKKIKSSCITIANVFPTFYEEHKIGEIICGIISDTEKRNAILQAGSEAPSPKGFKGLIEKVKKSIPDVDTLLYGELYATDAEKMGNEDANNLIEAIVNKKVKDSSEFHKFILFPDNYSNSKGFEGVIKKAKSSDETKFLPVSSYLATMNSTEIKLCDDCVYSNPKEKSKSFLSKSKKCAMCEKSVKGYWVCKGCTPKKKKIFCSDCYNSYFNQQPAQNNSK